MYERMRFENERPKLDGEPPSLKNRFHFSWIIFLQSVLPILKSALLSKKAHQNCQRDIIKLGKFKHTANVIRNI